MAGLDTHCKLRGRCFVVFIGRWVIVLEYLQAALVSDERVAVCVAAREWRRRQDGMPNEYDRYRQGTPEDANWSLSRPRWPEGASQHNSGDHWSSDGWGPAEGGWGSAGGWQTQPPDRYVPGGGFGQPGPQSGGGYGPGASNSRPFAGEQRPDDGYGQWAPYPGYQAGTAYGPPSQWGAGWSMAPSEPAPGFHRKLWIALAVLAILLLAGSALGVFAIQYFGPVGVANRFCGDLKAQSYSGAYELLGKQFQAAITEDDFMNAGVTLDRAEGSVLDCTISGGGGSLNPAFGASSITVSLSVRRAKVSAHVGIARLVNEDGSWKIGALDSAVWGVDLNAVQVMQAYCTALQSQAYTAAYALLGKKQTAGIKASDYAQMAQWRDQVDGSVSVCQIISVSAGNTEAAASFGVSITRHRLGEKQDTIGLNLEDAAWKINAIGQQLEGTDIGGIQTTARFCDDLSHGRYADAFGLLTLRFTGSDSESYVAAVFAGQINGIKWTGCTFDASTYKVSGSNASMSVDIDAEQLSTGRAAAAPVTMKLVRLGHAWKLDTLAVQS